VFTPPLRCGSCAADSPDHQLENLWPRPLAAPISISEPTSVLLTIPFPLAHDWDFFTHASMIPPISPGNKLVERAIGLQLHACRRIGKGLLRQPPYNFDDYRLDLDVSQRASEKSPCNRSPRGDA
jgi:hypothetical protein